jgi:hypothetical protein
MRPIGQKLELNQSNGYYMNSFRRFSANNQLWAIVLLVVILIVGFYSQVFRFAFGIPENENIFLVYWFAFSACLSAWVYADMRFRGISIYFDQGFLIYLAWPITFPYYLFKSRGFRNGCFTLLVFIGFYLFIFISAIFIGAITGIGRDLLLGN